MQVVYSTHSGLYIVEFDETNGIQTTSTMLETGYHYGLWINSPYNFVVYRGGEDVHSQSNRQLIEWTHDNDNGWTSDVIFSFDSDIDAIHQIVYTGKNKFLITNTLYNKINIVDTAQGKVVDEISIGNYNSDVNHINSILPIADGFVIVMLHNLRKNESELVAIDITNRKELDRFSLYDVQCHNIAIINDRIYYNGSGNRRVTSLSIHTGHINCFKVMAEHPKGMCASASSIYVGSSNYASRSKRGDSNGWITCLNLSNLEEKWTMDLVDGIRGRRVGNVNELRILDGVDLAARAPELSPGIFLRLCKDGGMSSFKLARLRLKIKFEDKLKRVARSIIYKK